MRRMRIGKGRQGRIFSFAPQEKGGFFSSNFRQNENNLIIFRSECCARRICEGSLIIRGLITINFRSFVCCIRVKQKKGCVDFDKRQAVRCDLYAYSPNPRAIALTRALRARAITMCAGAKTHSEKTRLKKFIEQKAGLRDDAPIPNLC